MNATLAWAALLAVAAAPPGKTGPTPPTNLLELAEGTVVVSVSSTYGSGWSALNLTDGSTAGGWCSARGAALPHTLILELPQPCAVASLAVDNTGNQEAGYPGISARSVTVYGSTSSAGEGFRPLAAIEAPRGGRGEVRLAPPPTAQWLKFVVNSNWGNAEYAEVMELEAYGRPVGAPRRADVAGVYATNYGPMRIEQDGGSVSGCYDYRDGEFTGNLNGRVMQFEWRQDGGRRSGTAVMVLSLKGEALNGVWFEDGRLEGEWSGRRGGPAPQCRAERSGGIAERLATAGRAVVYGIYFDSDASAPRPESDRALAEILAALQAQPSLRLLVAGHTDATGTAPYNLSLSQRRAGAVVSWLVAHGVASPRLTPKGFGRTQPVADNATASGRALNRRVELLAR